MKSQPVLLTSQSDIGTPLERIEARSQEGRDEAWLQSLIFDHPEILPVEEFDEAFAPAIPIGREIATPTGYIDNLYVSPSGAMTIVETKLWTNPERHRTVVAQVIDYAKELSRWDTDQLNAAILKASRADDGATKKSLDQLVKPHLEDAGMTPNDFQERLISTLQNGEFLLLVVGDAISPNLALLTESISGVPGLDFRLGLVELQLYLMGDSGGWPLLVVPEIVGRTVEKTRGIIKVQYVQERPELEIEIEDSDEPEKPKGKTTQDVFLRKAPEDLSEVYENWLNVWRDKRVVIYWGVEGFSLRVRIGGKLQTVCEAYPEWAVSLVRKSDRDRLKASDLDYLRYAEKLSSVPSAIDVLAAEKKFIKHESLTAEDLMTILQATDELVNILMSGD